MADACDPRTIFVRGIGVELGVRELEEAFSEIGPVRRSFLVGTRGEGKAHRGCGFVTFALADDAKKAAAELDGKLLRGHKVQVKAATRRAPLEERKQIKRCKETVSEQDTPPAKKARQTAQLTSIKDASKVLRTVALGNLSRAGLKAALRKASAAGEVEEVIAKVPEEDVSRAKLREDGCEGEAAFVTYRTVKEAVEAVGMLHGCKLPQKPGATAGSMQPKEQEMRLWARQLKGEGAMVKRWRVIIRNLPFNITAQDITQAFLPAGFVWQVTLPCDPDGASKGFAFASFTARAHAQNAILLMNGKSIKGRPVAVDWAVPKAAFQALNLPHEAAAASGQLAQPLTGGLDKDCKDSFDTEQCKGTASEPAEAVCASEAEEPIAAAESPVAATAAGTPQRRESGAKAGARPQPIQHSVFVRGLLQEATKQELQGRMEAFGRVRECRLVMNPLTGKCKGTAFVEFYSADAAGGAVAASTKGRAGEGPGVVLAGRPLDIRAALSAEEARLKAAQQPETPRDARNLYLAKEGQIQEESAAWQDMSKRDCEKRTRANAEKATKLRSPNFFVSPTRLCLRNLPYSMDEKALKQLLVAAVKAHAANAAPKLAQVKILRETGVRSKEGEVQSKGIAFAQFARHEHALCALRQLNNNPAPFGSERRPIVEFAVENAQTLKKREQREAGKKSHSRRPVLERESQLPSKEDAAASAKAGEGRRKRKVEPAAEPASQSPQAGHQVQNDGRKQASAPGRTGREDMAPNRLKSRQRSRRQKEAEAPDRFDRMVSQYKKLLFGSSRHLGASVKKPRPAGRWFE